jgi:hypothetical protein
MQIEMMVEMVVEMVVRVKMVKVVKMVKTVKMVGMEKRWWMRVSLSKLLNAVRSLRKAVLQPLLKYYSTGK